MRILLFGANGQVGWELARTLKPLGEVLALDYPEIDFLDLPSLRTFTHNAHPDLIVNAAAYTAVAILIAGSTTVTMRANLANFIDPGLLLPVDSTHQGNTPIL